MHKLIPTFGAYSEYAGSVIDLAFYHSKNMWSIMEPASLLGAW